MRIIALRRLLYISFLALSCLLGAGVPAWSQTESVRFRQGSSKVDEAYRQNAALDAIDKMLEENGLPLYINVRAASSPDGTISVNRRLAAARARNLAEALKARHPELPDSLFRTSVLEEDWSGVADFLRRSGKPYAAEAISIIESDSPDRKVQLLDLWVGEAWDYLTWNYFPRLRKADVTLVYAAEAPCQACEDASRILFAQGRTAVSPKYRQNALALGRVQAALTQEGAAPTAVTLRAWASPEGTVAKNEALARRRAEAVKAYIAKEYGVDPALVQIENMGEDWAGFRDAVVNTYTGAYLPEILAVLDNPALSVVAKKRKLQAIDGGSVWKALVAGQMKPLRAVEVCVQIGPQKIGPVPPVVPITDTSVVVPPPPVDTTTVVVPPPPVDTTTVVVPPPVDTTVVVPPPVDTTIVIVTPPPVVPSEPVRRPILGVSTNLAFDAATAVNLGVSVPVGRHWQLGADVYFPWWSNAAKMRAFQWAHADLSANYYFKGWQDRQTSQVFRGFFAGATLGGGLFDIEWNGSGYQGEELAAKLRAGYNFRLGQSWRLGLYAGGGVAFTQYRPYDVVVQDGVQHLLYDDLVPPVRRFVPSRMRVFPLPKSFRENRVLAAREIDLFQNRKYQN